MGFLRGIFEKIPLKQSSRQSLEKDGIIMKEVQLYTDGACSGNPGPGGYGAILVFEGKEKKLQGGEKSTTNNRMELMGAIVGLEALKEPCRVLLTSDSKYLVDAVEKKWLENWQKRGWKKADGKPALNVDLWQRLQAQLDRHAVTFRWIKGHAGHAYNERCDALAREAIGRLQQESRSS